MNALTHLLSPTLHFHPLRKSELPLIPERPGARLPASSVSRRRKQKSQNCIKYHSQIGISPEQQHIEDQLKIAIGDYKQIKQQFKLPSIQVNNKKGNDKEFRRVPQSRTKPLSKLSLKQIFKNPQKFVQGYFEDLNKLSQ